MQLLGSFAPVTEVIRLDLLASTPSICQLIVGVIAVVVVAGLLASWFPARRAARSNAMEIIRRKLKNPAMRRLAEMTEVWPMELHDGVVSTTAEVWEMLCASRDGDLDHVRRLIERCPALRSCQYDYTSPLHFAVREGHFDLAPIPGTRG